jgi:hypothetical protein
MATCQSREMDSGARRFAARRIELAHIIDRQMHKAAALGGARA